MGWLQNADTRRINTAGIAQQFDANGNLTPGMGFTFTWDAEDRVKSISLATMERKSESNTITMARGAGFASARWTME
jgi:hypothetical protein